MPIDPRISLGVQPLQVADPMARYSQLASIQSAQNQNALAQYQLSAAQRSDEQQNKLYAASQQPEFKLDFASAIKYGAPGLAAFKAQEEAAAAGLTRTETQGKIDKQKYEAVDSRLKFFRGGLDTIDPDNPSSPQAYKNWIIAGHNDPIIGPAIKARGGNLEQSLAQVDAAVTQGPQAFSQLVNQSRLGVEKFMELNKPTTTTVDQGGQKQMFQTPGLGGKPVSVGTYADVPLPANVLAQKKDIARSGASNIGFKQEAAFEAGLGKGQADRIVASQAAAQDAAAIIDTVKTGRDIMKSGMITGAGADFLVNLNQGLKTAGIDSGYADAAANSQAFAANMAGNVGKLIKQFGAGTGLSDADREFAKDMAGGRISLDAKAINRILDINERAARNTITRHNKDVKGIKTNIPLEVEMPPAAPSAPVVTAPAAAIDYLRANPSMKGAFDAKYGAGSADRALKGQ